MTKLLKPLEQFMDFFILALTKEQTAQIPGNLTINLMQKTIIFKIIAFLNVQKLLLCFYLVFGTLTQHPNMETVSPLTQWTMKHMIPLSPDKLH